MNKVDFDNYEKGIFSLNKVKQNTIMKTCLFHNAAYMELRNYISKYCEKIVFQRKYPTLCMISLYIMYVTTFYIKNIFYFPKKNNSMLVTPRTEMYEGVLHI